MAKNMAKLEEILRREKEEKSSMNHDVSAVRDLCVKLESSKDLLSRQLTSKSLEFERVKEKKCYSYRIYRYRYRYINPFFI